MNSGSDSRNISKVTVVIPTYNSRKTISRCLDSVVLQGCQWFEAIVVDDGSVDGTVEIVKNYIANNKSGQKIFLYELKVNSGPSFARNYGIEIAKHDWVLFLDSDDEWCHDRIEKFMGFIDENREAKIVFSRYRYVDGTEIPGAFMTTILKYFYDTAPRLLIFIKSFIATPTIAFNKKFINERFDVKIKYCEDLDFILRISKLNKIFFQNNIVVNEIFRAGEKSSLSCNTCEMKKNNINVLGKNVDNFFEKIIFCLKKVYFTLK